jgi:tetratricopeptide (TPR) repeat protein
LNRIDIAFNKTLAVLAGLFKQDALVLNCWEKINAALPNDSGSLAALAHLYAQQGRVVQALGYAEQAARLAPHEAHYWYNLGFLLQAEGLHSRAIAAFDKTLEINSKFDRALYGKALSLIKLEQYELAVSALELNTKLQPLSPYGWYQMALVYHKLQDSVRVAKIIERVARFEPQVALQLQAETGINVGIKSPFA